MLNTVIFNILCSMRHYTVLTSRVGKEDCPEAIIMPPQSDLTKLQGCARDARLMRLVSTGQYGVTEWQRS